MQMKWLAGIGLAGLAAGLVGCGEQTPTAGTASKPLMMVAADGVGPINAQTRFNLHELTLAFQGLNVTEQTSYTAGAAYTAITVKQDTRHLLTINPDVNQQKIYSVQVHDNLVGNQLGHGIGTPYRAIYTIDSTEQCAPGQAELQGKVLCYAPKVGNIIYIFGGKWEGALGTVPPKDKLADWVLEAIVWKPPVM